MKISPFSLQYKSNWNSLAFVKVPRYKALYTINSAFMQVGWVEESASVWVEWDVAAAEGILWFSWRWVEMRDVKEEKGGEDESWSCR